LKNIFGKLLIFNILSVMAIVKVVGQSSNLFYALEFAENKGQWGDSFEYRANVGLSTIFLNADGYTMLVHNQDDYQRIVDKIHGTVKNSEPPTGKSIDQENLRLRSHAYKVNFIGGNPNAMAISEKPLQTNINYFLGNDSSRWKTGLSSFETVTYKDVYPGIDVRYYSDAGQLKYDLIIEPGADISAIRLKYEGVDKLSLKNDQLLIRTSTGEVREKEPYSFRIKDGYKEVVECKFVVRGDEVRFNVKNHDPSLKLIIDPQFVFGTFSGSRSDNWGYSATPGPDGSLFAAGIVFDVGYPVRATGAIFTNFNGGTDIAVSRYRTDGGNPRVMYSLMLGGDAEDIPQSIISDAYGNLVILGRTASSNYPRRGYQSVNRGGTDIIVTKINATGSALIGSAIIGGTADDGQNISQTVSACRSLQFFYGDNTRSEVILDPQEDVLVVSNTQSANFPTLNAFQSLKGGSQDAVVFKLRSDLSSLVFSSYLGGANDDAGFCIKVHPQNGEIYVAGPTLSDDFPGNKTNTIGAISGGQIDGYVAIISSNGSSLLKSTYLATSEVDMIYGLQFDKRGFPYVTGITLGNWPVLNAAYSNPGSKQFISKLKPDLSAYEFSTVFGSANTLPNISIVGFLVDRCDNIYVSGWGGSLGVCYGGPLCSDFRNAGTIGMPTTPDAIRTITDNRDFYVIVLKRNSSGLLYGSFIGQYGGATDHVDGGTSRFDARGALYMAVCANCGGNNFCGPNIVSTRFPLRNPAFSVNGAASAEGCNLGAIKIDFDFDGVDANLQAAIDGVINDTVGCFPLKVDFEDVVGVGTTFIWDFGDGTKRDTTSTPNNSHVFMLEGTYRVMLIAIDSSRCIPSDTAYRTIKASKDRTLPDFSSVKLPPCANLSMEFTNLTVAPVGRPFAPNSFMWDFGDGTPPLRTGPGPVVHTYPSMGVYNVKLTIDDDRYCNAPETKTRTVRISANVEALFNVEPAPNCKELTYNFDNVSFGGVDFRWDFGDGSPIFVGSTPPSKTYANPGVYTVTLTATDPNTCNVIDVESKIINAVLIPKPKADFDFSPNPSLENTPTQFINRSQKATQYNWDFGDGSDSQDPNPNYQYVRTAINNVCLIASNDLGCADTLCRPVESKVVVYYDVPNAFTPNGDGKNDKVAVRGFGIVKMDFKIYNRWGQLVFRSTDPSQGWDGYYQGRLQPMDVYGYTLELEMYNGQRYTKKGDITLLR